MPAFNSAGTVVRAIESVLSQSFTDWSLTIVDDGSSDDTSKIVRAYLKKHNITQIHLETLPANVGVAEARNVGIAQSAGEWIVFFDADDEMYETHLERLIDEATGETDIVICGRTVVLPSGREYGAHSAAVGSFSGAEATRLSLANKLTPFPWDRIIRRSLFSDFGFPTGAVRMEDSMTNIVLCSRARRVASIPSSGIRYFVSGGSITWGKIYTLEDTRIAWDFMLAHLPPQMTEGRFRTALACARANIALVIGQTALSRRGADTSDERAQAIRQTVAECRAHIRPGDVARSLVSNRTIGLAALLFKLLPGVYGRMYRRFVAAQYAITS